MLSLILAAVIMVKTTPAGEVRLHDTVGKCEVGYTADLVVDVAELVADPKVVDTGCWVAEANDPYFTVVWSKSGETVRYEKEGTAKVTAPTQAWKTGAATTAVLAAIAAGDFEESKPASP